MLSDLLRFQLADQAGKRGRLCDLVVDVAGGDYPPVTHLLIRRDGEAAALWPWDTGSSIDWRRRRLVVRDLSGAETAEPEALQQRVLLARDVLDSMVLDIANRQATRANDLWLREQAGRLLLRGVDAGVWAVLRRVSRGLLRHRLRDPFPDQANEAIRHPHGAAVEPEEPAPQGPPARIRGLLDWRDVEFLRGHPRAALQGQDYRRRIGRLRPVEIARLLEALPYLHAAELVTLLPDPAAADTLEAMSPERQVQVFEELEADQAARLLALMAPDAAADLLGRIAPDLAKDHLERLPAARRDRVLELLRYPEDTAGGIMTNDLVIAPGSLTVGEARQTLAEQLKAPDFVYYVYVVDTPERRRLLGVLTLRDLFLAHDMRRLVEVMEPDVAFADPLEPAVAAARRVAEQHLAALPVVGGDGRLLGAITADAAVAQIAPASWRRQAPRIFS